jgi:hypothetical protein
MMDKQIFDSIRNKYRKQALRQETGANIRDAQIGRLYGNTVIIKPI